MSTPQSEGRTRGETGVAIGRAATCAALALLAAGTALAQLDGQTIRGNSGQWTMVVRTPWMGGGRRDIREVIDKRKLERPNPEPQKADLDRLLALLDGMFGQEDALLLRMDTDLQEPAYPTLLRIIYDRTDLPLEAFVSGFAKAAHVAAESAMAKVTCTYVETKSKSIAGMPSARAFYRCSGAGQPPISIVWFQLAPPGRMVSAFVQMDARSQDRRVQEVEAMLATIRFEK